MIASSHFYTKFTPGSQVDLKTVERERERTPQKVREEEENERKHWTEMVLSIAPPVWLATIPLLALRQLSTGLGGKVSGLILDIIKKKNLSSYVLYLGLGRPARRIP